MTELEKVIKEWESVLSRDPLDAPWDLIDETLALLKEQEAKPLRCKECSYHRNDGWCNEHGREVKESDYCSFGAWEGR
jgi:hypothetical protein